MKIEENKIRFFFDYSGSGLIKRGENLIHFEIAGAYNKFKKADAVIENSTVVVSNENVPDPVAVR